MSPVQHAPPDGPPGPLPAWRRRWPALTLFSAIGVILLGGAIAWTYTNNLRKYPPDVADRRAMIHPLPDHPSLVVLPFSAVTGGARDNLIADRLATDLTDALVRVPQIFVIARESAIRYRGARFQIKKTAETLGVRYLVSGTLSRSGETYRVFYRLLDAFTGEADWVGDYKRPLSTLPAARDLAVTEILDELDSLPDDAPLAELLGPQPGHPETWLSLAEVTTYRIPEDRQSMRGGLARLMKAQETDPSWAAVPAEIAWTYLNAVRRHWTSPDAPDDKTLVKLGLIHADRTMRLDPADPRGPARKADLLALAGDDTTTLALRERAAALGPNDFTMQWELAQTLIALEAPARALPVMQRALRLHPLHPASMTRSLADLQLAAGDPEAALNSLSTIVARRPAQPGPRIMRIYLLELLDRPEEAQREALALLDLHPDFTLSRWRAGQTDPGHYDDVKWEPALRAAGIPD